MSTGTNSQRITQNNELLQQHNLDLSDILETINNLPEAIDTSDATATAADIVQGKTAYTNGQKITGTIFDSRGGTVNPYQNQLSTSDGELVITGTMPQDPIVVDITTQCITPIPYSDIANVVNLTSDKLLSGNTILDVEGTATSDATATADDMVRGKTAYVNGQKVTGNVYQHQTGASWTLADNQWSINRYNGILIPFNESTMFQTGTSIYISDTSIINKADITSEKIKLGETIFGVTGTYKGDSTIIQANTVEELPTETEENKIAVILDSNKVYGGTYQAKYTKSESATTQTVQQDNLAVGMNVTMLDRTTYAPSSTMADITEDKLFFKNSSGSIWYGAKYDNTTDPENPILKILLIDNNITYHIGYYDYNQAKWNQQIDEDITLSEVCKISEVSLDNLDMMNNEFEYVTINNSDLTLNWVELAGPGTITSSEYAQALRTSKNILGVSVEEGGIQ